jgi:citryl-CoA lyase
MEWKTSISKAQKDKTILRGYNLEELSKNISFTKAIFLTLKGEMPTEQEENMLNAILVSAIDHGIEPSSAYVARSVASTGNQFNSSVSAGVAAMGRYHGGAIEDCARALKIDMNAKDKVKDAIRHKKTILGFGHKLYKSEDPRTKILMEVAKENKVFGHYCEHALEIEHELELQKDKKLVLNVDGAIAAIILDMGFEYRLANAFFIISRTVGLCAHIHEEITTEKPVRRLEESIYTGPIDKKL